MSRKTQARGGRYCGIGMEHPKTADNLGTLWRSAVCFGASFIFTIGDRYHKQASDTVKSWRHVPYFRYTDLDDFHAHLPYDCVPVGVEITDLAKPLETYQHPRNAVYLLGPEDGGLSRSALLLCHEVINIDTTYCLNVASAGTVVLYDRQAKGWRQGSVAQLGERLPETQEAAGSTPARTTENAA